MFTAYGRRYYESQIYEFELFYARKEDGSFAARSIGAAKPRQNGKSYVARDYGLDSACMDGKRVLYSAHLGKTVRDMYKEMKAFIKSHEDFCDEIMTIYQAAGYEGFYFKNGGCVEFQTRTNNAARGGTYDIVIIDEAQELTTAQQEALLPTVSAAQELEEGSGTQVIYLGTPPNEMCQGTVFQDMHDRAHKGEGSVWWLEWAAQGDSLKDIDLDDTDLWYATNPAMGRRISEETVRNERDTMSDAGFARERLGWWAPTSLRYEHCIDAEQWSSCATDDPPEDGLIAYAVRFSPDGHVGSLCACVKPDDGIPHVELIETKDMSVGVGWFADWLIPRADDAAQIVIDGKANAEALKNMLHGAGVPKSEVWMPQSREVVAASSMLLDAVRSNRVTHYDQAQLNDSATKTKKRTIGQDGGWGFASTEFADASPIEAAALSYWAAMTTRRKPNEEQFVWL